MEYTNNIIYNMTYFVYAFIILGIIYILTVVEKWILFNKLGEKGWKSIIPIYNDWVYLELGGLQGWLILLPVANLIGMLLASFNIPKKLNKSAMLGLVYIFLPNIYYLILILDKSNVKKEENNNDNSSNVSQLESVENKIEEKTSEFVEAPALNTEETKIPETTKLNNAYINIMPEPPKIQEEPKFDEDITSAFEMPMPELNLEIQKTNELVDTLTKLKQSDLNLNIDSEPTLELETLENNSLPKIDNDILEETVELPKMVNEEVNNDIKATKHCNNCGFENEYSLKKCIKCGEPLE